jgi:hypothetical protein
MNTKGFRCGSVVVRANLIRMLGHLRSGHSQKKKGSRSRFEIEHGEENVRRATETLLSRKVKSGMLERRCPAAARRQHVSIAVNLAQLVRNDIPIPTYRTSDIQMMKFNFAIFSCTYRCCTVYFIDRGSDPISVPLNRSQPQRRRKPRKLSRINKWIFYGADDSVTSTYAYPLFFWTATQTRSHCHTVHGPTYIAHGRYQ